MSLESLYQEIILEHSKQRSGEHLVEVPAGHASADNHQYNPPAVTKSTCVWCSLMN